mmetsp:Transcript_75057/g.213476  ORF Transcript_75057/g.213476 Transcript_75057/m.213476 type:complete len:305 (-) Transcript_75057:1012-1926(-)
MTAYMGMHGSVSRAARSIISRATPRAPSMTSVLAWPASQDMLHIIAAAHRRVSGVCCFCTRASTFGAPSSITVWRCASLHDRLKSTDIPTRCVRWLSTCASFKTAQRIPLAIIGSLCSSECNKLNRKSAHTALTSSLFVRRIAMTMKSSTMPPIRSSVKSGGAKIIWPLSSSIIIFGGGGGGGPSKTLAHSGSQDILQSARALQSCVCISPPRIELRSSCWMTAFSHRTLRQLLSHDNVKIASAQTLSTVWSVARCCSVTRASTNPLISCGVWLRYLRAVAQRCCVSTDPSPASLFSASIQPCS